MSDSRIRHIARQEINNKLLERDFLNILFGTNLKDKINSQLNKYIRSNKFNERVNFCVDERLNQKLPSIIANSAQLEIILNNNLIRMENSYNKKEFDLEIKLSKSAESIIEKVVSDPQYTSIIDPHIHAINKKGKIVISKFENEGSSLLNNYKKELESIKKKYDTEIDEKIQQLERTVRPLQVIGGTIVKLTIVGVGAGVLLKIFAR